MIKNNNKTVVYIDGSAFTAHPSGGVAHYAYEICLQLARYPDLDVNVVLFRGEAVKNLPLNITIHYVPFPRRLYSIIWKKVFQIPVNYFLFHKRIDAVLYLNFATSPTIIATKKITIVHDLAFIHFPETIEHRNRSYLNKAVQRSVDQSDIIGFPSYFTKNDFLNRYSFGRESFVAYPGYKLPSGYTTLSTITIPDKFLLTIGTIEPRKNISALCEAFQRSTFYKEGGYLLIAGKKGWGSETLPNNPKIIHIDTPSDAERDFLLKNCQAFVFPSLFEGFGMPVIEAMNHNKPIISTNNSSLAEIVTQENAYIITSPATPDAILLQIEAYYLDINKRPHSVDYKITEAKRSVKRFNWDVSGKIFYDTIRGK